MSELKNILFELEIIKNSEHSFVQADFADLMKSLQLVKYECGERIAKQDEDASTMFLILQGTVLATYKLAEQDRRGVFFGKKCKNDDGFIKTLKTLAVFKSSMSKALEGHNSRGSSVHSSR